MLKSHFPLFYENKNFEGHTESHVNHFEISLKDDLGDAQGPTLGRLGVL